MLKTLTAVAVLGMVVGTTADLAQARSRHHTAGHSVRAHQHRNAMSPGSVPQTDAKQSATGGQPGGQPGQE